MYIVVSRSVRYIHQRTKLIRRGVQIYMSTSRYCTFHEMNNVNIHFTKWNCGFSTSDNNKIWIKFREVDI